MHALAKDPFSLPTFGRVADELRATLAQQKLLFDAAAKTGDAGEPALSIELYGRLLTRFPQGPFAEQARSAIEAQKRKLAKA